MIKIKTVDDYISLFPKEIKGILQKLRKTIKKSAPNAQEVISYNMPAFKVNKKILLYYAVQKKHIGFYPFPSSIKAFKKELLKFETSKGAIRFPLDKKIPFSLVGRIVKQRVREITGSKIKKEKIKGS